MFHVEQFVLAVVFHVKQKRSKMAKNTPKHPILGTFCPIFPFENPMKNNFSFFPHLKFYQCKSALSPLKIDPFLFRKKYNKMHYGFTFFYKKANLMFFQCLSSRFLCFLRSIYPVFQCFCPYTSCQSICFYTINLSTFCLFFSKIHKKLAKILIKHTAKGVSLFFMGQSSFL